MYNSFAPICCVCLGAAPIPYIQDVIVNPSNPYTRSTTVLRAKITVSHVKLVYMVHVNLHIEIGTSLQQVILDIYLSSMQSKKYCVESFFLIARCVGLSR